MKTFWLQTTGQTRYGKPTFGITPIETTLDSDEFNSALDAMNKKFKDSEYCHCGREDDFLKGEQFSKEDLEMLADIAAFSFLNNEIRMEEIEHLLELTKAQRGGYGGLFLIDSPRLKKLDYNNDWTYYKYPYSPDRPDMVIIYIDGSPYSDGTKSMKLTKCSKDDDPDVVIYDGFTPTYYREVQQ